MVVAIAAVIGAAIVALLSNSSSKIEAWSLGSAYAAFLLLAISMGLGPLKVIRRKHNPVHSALRRDVGICAGIAALVHTVLGLQVHLGGSLAAYFSITSSRGWKSAAFVAANYIGLVSALLLGAVALVSNDVAIRSLGIERWKRIQRTVYVAAVAAVVHGFIYQFLEGRSLLPILSIAIVVGAVVAMQFIGRSRWRAAARADSVERSP